jgi:antitoxin ParD1/3/4
MNVSLTPELEQLVQDKVKSGLYLSESEVVREALRLLEQRDRMSAVKLDKLRKEIQLGIDQADRGELRDGPQVFRKLRSKITTARQNRRGG